MVQAYTRKINLDTLPTEIPSKAGLDANDGIRKLCLSGLQKIGKSHDQVYIDRMNEELEVIIGKDFSIYFIILWDVMLFCRRENIATGAARGSAGGSLVSYLLQITAIDPIEYGLLFWRFLDPSREEAPDIDLDIADKDRWKVRKYLEDEYGVMNVAGISTVNYFSFKSAFKGACRVLAVPFKEANGAVANVETVEDALRTPEFVNVLKKYPDVAPLTKALEGRISGVGMHAAAIVVTRLPLHMYTSLESRGAKDAEFRQKVVALDKKMAERLGLVKIDFLGLKSLSVIADTEALVAKNHKRIINWKELKTDAPDSAEVYKMLSDGHTLGVFQAEQSASTNLIKDMGVHNFNDLVASNALVRSGAWNAFGPDFVARKKGHKRAVSIHPDCDWFLGDTQQLALYQEQTMLMCTELAGLTMKEANAIRKLTSHKEDKATLAPYKKSFVDGASKKINKEEALKLWENIETTSEYQFNKCLAADTRVDVRYRKEDDAFWTMDTLTMEQLHTEWNEGIFVIQVLGPEKVSKRKVSGLMWHNVTHVTDNGIRPTMRVWTDSEHYIDATMNHRHRLAKSWKQTYRIHQGDPIWTDGGKIPVAGRRYAGLQQVYDLGIDTDHHAFFANGFVTHNSHSVGYSRLSYAMAYLKCHYPAEFMVALLNNEQNQGSISDYLAECKRLKIEVRTPNVNHSDMHYSNEGNVIYMGLANIKFISDKLAERIVNLRPIKSYEDLHTRIMAKGSGLSSRVLGALNAVGATEFPDHPIDPEEVKNNFYEYLGIPSFDSGMITPEMRARTVSMPDYDPEGTQIVVAIVKDIVSKGWTRIEIIDGDGSASFFAESDHGLQKGHRYIMLISSNSLVDYLDLSDYNWKHPLSRYLRGQFDEGYWLVGAKARVTKNNKRLATMVYSANGSLLSCIVFESMLAEARQVPRGTRIKIATSVGRGGGKILQRIGMYE